MSILVVGSVALDSVKTPFGKRDDLLGGSATFFAIAASFFDKVHIVATVGEDFPKEFLALFKKRDIGLDGLNISKGKTFRWSGSYNYDMNVATTISTHLNVFKNFKALVPRSLRRLKFVFLANIDPELQYSILMQMDCPKLIACDSMNYWIEHKRKYILKLLKKVHILLLNDTEARQLSGEENLMKAAQSIISNGPKAVIIKKGEAGALYVSKRSSFIAPAYPLESICDPTGAGDTFAGGLIGFLSKVSSIADLNIRRGIIYGSILASFAVEEFSINRLLKLSIGDIKARFEHFRRLTKF